MRTAVVHDWLNGMRGGEKVLEQILPLVPDPTIFTLFHAPGSVSPAIERYPIRVSYLNRLPFAGRHYRSFLPLFPAAVEAFDLSGFDLVVSSSHCVAKGAMAPPGVPHLCYCHTPMRYAYEQFDLYFPKGRTRLRPIKSAVVARLRSWDERTAGRPTHYLANSKAVAGRIQQHYGRDSTVLPPPVEVDFFTSGGAPRSDFLLSVGALVPYKRFEDVILASGRLRRPLVLVGRGPEERRLRDLAGPSVKILVDLSAGELRDLYRSCALFVQPGEEDFGIAAAEALACGAPVVALSRGGVLDMVSDGIEGVLYAAPGVEPLAQAIERATALRFDYNRLRSTALRFSPDRFREGFRTAVEDLLGARATDEPMNR
jgi:glycosyltransferase involved in cell wall biosynthesis